MPPRQRFVVRAHAETEYVKSDMMSYGDTVPHILKKGTWRGAKFPLGIPMVPKGRRDRLGSAQPGGRPWGNYSSDGPMFAEAGFAAGLRR